MECLSIDILLFIIINFVHVWIFVGISYFISQLFIIIQKFSSSNIKFLFVENVFLWVKFRSFWRCHSVVKLCIWSVSHFLNKDFSCTIVFNFNCDLSFHGIVSDCSVRTFNFFYSVLMSSNLGFSEFELSEFHLTIFVVLNCFDFSTFRVFQHEAKLASFQFTAFEFLSEVEFDFNWN